MHALYIYLQCIEIWIFVALSPTSYFFPVWVYLISSVFWECLIVFIYVLRPVVSSLRAPQLDSALVLLEHKLIKLTFWFLETVDMLSRDLLRFTWI